MPVREARRRVPADHPCLPGHFPGRPIVPAVLILAEVEAVVAEAALGRRVAGIVRAKFHRPLDPDTVFVVTVRTEAGTADFACRDEAGGLIADGRLTLG